MLTNNYYTLWEASMLRPDSDGPKAKLQLISTLGVTEQTSCYLLYSTYDTTYSRFLLSAVTQASYSNTSFGVLFGSGTISPSRNDFEITNVLDSSKITIVAPRDYCLNRQSDYFEVEGTYGVSAKEDVTITELGTIVRRGYRSGTTSAYVHYLIDHTMLDKPITLRAGESTQITYAIRINYMQ